MDRSGSVDQRGREPGQQYGFTMPALTAVLLRAIPVAVLSLTALIVGNFFGKRRYSRPSHQSASSRWDPLNSFGISRLASAGTAGPCSARKR
jgi:hypothetical protein